jgi:predicted AAA+ superfamily ATPase
MLTSYLPTINPWWENEKFRHKVIERPRYVNVENLTEDRLIKIFIGSRRVGKTNLLYSIINHLLEQDINPRHILYLTGELRELENSRLLDVVSDFQSSMQIKRHEKFYLIVDEVQEIAHWQKDLKFLYDNLNIKIYATGSSSLVLSAGASKLTGRFYLDHVFPLSFEEYLTFKKQTYPKSGKLRVEITEEYLHSGGYPEFVLNNKPDYLRQVVESTLYRDLLTLYGVRNPQLLKDLLYYLSDKVTTPVSAKTVEKDLKVSDETVRFYLKYLQDVYLIYPAYKFGASHRITKSSNPKYYFNDTGILHTITLNKRISHLAENAVFLKLLSMSKSKEDSKIRYFVSKTSQEVDFIDDEKKLYEVKYKTNLTPKEDIEPYEILERELAFIHPSGINKNALPFYYAKPVELGSFLLQQ